MTRIQREALAVMAGCHPNPTRGVVCGNPNAGTITASTGGSLVRRQLAEAVDPPAWAPKRSTWYQLTPAGLVRARAGAR